MINSNQLAQLFGIGRDNPITLRALAGGPVQNHNFCPDTYPEIGARWRAFARTAQQLNDSGYNIYTCLNPVLPSHRCGPVSDDSIACRRRLLIDIDRKHTGDVPATDAEVKDAWSVGDAIEQWLSPRLGSEPCRVMSGNGAHLYYALADWPNDAASRDRCRRLLHGLAQMFDTDLIKVDTAVHNASRITKVPGTIARKGKESADRPFRQAVML